MDGAQAQGAGDALLVEDFRHVVLTVAAYGGGTGPTFTLQFQAAVAEDQPDWGSAQGNDNLWEYVQVVDLNDRTSIDGDTGFSVSGSNDTRLFEVNTNLIRWFNARITSYSDGQADVRAIARTN